MINQDHGTRQRIPPKWRLVIKVGAILLILLILGSIPQILRTKRIDTLAAENPLPRVTLLEITPNTKPIELILPSSAQAWHITPIWARVNGYLTGYMVDIGDSVKIGDLLAIIDTPENDEELAQAKADLDNSIAERDIAKITSDRWQGLWNKNREAVTKQEVDQYNANLIAAEALVVANEKNVSRLTFLQQFKYIHAPFDGVITKRLIDLGSLIYGNINGNLEELFEIAQTHIVRFFVDVPQTYFQNIQVGIDAEATLPQLPGKIFKGKVTRFAQALDPTARTMQTQIDIDNPDGLLYPGLYGRIKFLLRPDTVNFIIPTTAVIIRSGYPHVAIVDRDNIVHLSQVQIGRDYGNKMEIVWGLNNGDYIIVLPSDRIHEGVKVEIIPNSPIK